MRAQRPLESIRVLELGTSIAGPYCSAILGALGADVIKLERPGTGDDTREWGPPFWNGESATFLAMNVGKRSIAVDIKNPSGVAVVAKIAASVDVVVQNLRPGLIETLGIGFDALATQNDKLVYCSISSFGSQGPLAENPGYDPLMQAAAGIMSITGEVGRPPVRTGPSIVDQSTGMWAVIAILAALRKRDAGGGPQIVETSLYEAAVNWLPYQIVGFLASGVAPQPLGSGISILAPYEAFPTKDGWVMIAAGNDRLFRKLCDVLAAPELADDASFATNSDRVRNRAELVSRIGALVAGLPSEQLTEMLRAAGVPAAPVVDVSEVVNAEQTEALKLIQPLPTETVPELQVVAPPLTMNSVRLGWQTGPPALGAHSVEVLRECAFREEEIDALLTSGVVEQAP